MGVVMKGRAWELALEAMHDQYRREGLAVVWKTEPRRDARGRHIEKAPPDYVGVVGAGLHSHAVVFDAKDCTQPRFALGKIKPHQAMDLEAAWRRGARAFIALRFNGSPYLIRWESIRQEYQAWRKAHPDARASVDLAWLAEWAVPMVGADWLGVL